MKHLFRKGYTPWNKGKKATEATKKKMSEARAGHKISEKTKKKISLKNKGRIFSEVTKQKQSKAAKILWQDPEHRKKMSLAHIGNIPWNKGKKGLQTAWCKGKICSQISIALQNKHPSDVTRKKQSESHIGKYIGDKNPNWKGGDKFVRGRSNARRDRELGFTPLNDCECDFWVGHHLDKEYVLYIPEEIHAAVRHTQSNQASMDRINEMVIDWYVNYYGLR